MLAPFGGVPRGELLFESLNHGDQVLGVRGQLVGFPVMALELVHGPGVFPLKPRAKEGQVNASGAHVSSTAACVCIALQLRAGGAAFPGRSSFSPKGAAPGAAHVPWRVSARTRGGCTPGICWCPSGRPRRPRASASRRPSTERRPPGRERAMWHPPGAPSAAPESARSTSRCPSLCDAEIPNRV